MSPCRFCEHSNRDKNICIDEGCRLPRKYADSLNRNSLRNISSPSIPVARVDQFMKVVEIPEKSSYVVKGGRHVG